jgi:hypothetical protein
MGHLALRSLTQSGVTAAHHPRKGILKMRTLSTLAPLAAVAAAALAPAAASAAVVPKMAGVEGTTWAEFDQVNASTATLTRDRTRAYEGVQSAKAVFNGGGNGYSRGIWNVDWRDGDEVSYGAAFYLPVGFKATMQGQVDLLRWDNYTVDPTATDRSGIIINNYDKKARIVRQRLNIEEVPLANGFDLPEGRWFHLEVHQKLNKGAGALSEVFLDGRLVASSTQPNTYGRPVTRIRTGIVAIDANRQTKPLTLWFDRASVNRLPVGPGPDEGREGPRRHGDGLERLERRLRREPRQGRLGHLPLELGGRQRPELAGRPRPHPLGRRGPGRLGEGVRLEVRHRRLDRRQDLDDRRLAERRRRRHREDDVHRPERPPRARPWRRPRDHVRHLVLRGARAGRGGLTRAGTCPVR